MILTTLVAAIAVGIAAQIVAERFQLPAILPLLVLGVFLGPAGLALFDPDALGHVLEAFIHLGVAVILFEGGLTLDPDRLLRVGAPVRNLLTLGVAVTGCGAAVLARLALDMPWPLAVLFGAIMTVTGPTVIVPLLRHMIAPQEVKTVLVSEGLIIDPIGAVLAYLVLQWIERAGIPFRELVGELTMLTASGAILGFVSGALARLVVRSRLIGRELRNLSILALLMVCYIVSEHQAPQSGVLAAVVMGFTMSAAELPDLVSLRAFKGQLTTLVISVLFILLAGQLKLETIAGLGWRGVLVVAGLVFVVRPVSVLVSVWPGHLPWRDRLVLAATAPRGIVAAAVASLAVRHLEDLGLGGAAAMEGLVYLAILLTCGWSTLVALVLPWILGYVHDPARRRAVLVGANPLTAVLAEMLRRSGRTTVVVDGVSWRLDRFREAGVGAVCGDARDAITYEEAGVARDSLVVAATTNDELNLLVAELVHAEFGVEHPVVTLQSPPEEFGRRSRAWMDLIGGRSTNVAVWMRRLESGTASRLEVDGASPEVAAALRTAERETSGGVLRLAAWEGAELSLRVAENGGEDERRLVLLVADGRPAELLAPFAMATEDEEDQTP